MKKYSVDVDLTDSWNENVPITSMNLVMEANGPRQAEVEARKFVEEEYPDKLYYIWEVLDRDEIKE
jgi:hypothetical protein